MPDLGDALQGSSPLTRGKHPLLGYRRRRGGLIPAHAGKTLTRPPPSRTPRAHPRSRGENAMSRSTLMPRSGSSPLTRGKRSPLYPAGHARGLIPAHAGKTRKFSRMLADHRAHPRSRGENLIGYSITQKHLGSSPLTRGKRRPSRLPRWRRGLIPAHAGKTHTPKCSA